MQKIASPEDLQAELRRLLAASQEHRPSRQALAADLRALADRVAGEPVAANGALKWGMFADACDSAGRELNKLAKEVDDARKHAEGDEKADAQKIFESVKKAQLEVDHAAILSNTLATKLRKAR